MQKRNIIAILLIIGALVNITLTTTATKQSIAKTKKINPEGYYYKTTEKTHREIWLTKTQTGVNYKLRYSKLSLPYDIKNNVSVLIEGVTGSALKIATNTYRQTLGDYSITFKISKKNKIRHLKVTQNGTLSGAEGNLSFSATFVHFADEQAQGGPNMTVKAAKRPGKIKITRLVSGLEKIYVYFKPLKKNCKGYLAQISTKKDFKNIIAKDISGKKNSGVEFVGLKSQKKYYIRIRAYNTNSIGKKRYGKWSKVKIGVAG